METKLVNVTPELAALWLEKNTGNRPMRRHLVLRLRDAFSRGEYVQTHQGIAFSDEGVLLDGQHRLKAISELGNGAVFPMLVSRGLASESFKTMDIGAIRNDADALQIKDRKLVETARLVTKLAGVRSTPSMLIPIINNIYPEYSALTDACQGTAKVFSSATVRLAAIVALKTGSDPAYVYKTWKALIVCDTKSLSSAAESFLRQVVTGRVQSTQRTELYSKAVKAFDSRKKNAQNLRADENAYELLRGVFAGVL